MVADARRRALDPDRVLARGGRRIGAAAAAAVARDPPARAATATADVTTIARAETGGVTGTATIGRDRDLASVDDATAGRKRSGRRRRVATATEPRARLWRAKGRVPHRCRRRSGTMPGPWWTATPRWTRVRRLSALQRRRWQILKRPLMKEVQRHLPMQRATW